MQRSDEKEEINIKINIVGNEPSKKEVKEFMEYASATGCNGELSAGESTTYWSAKDTAHSWDGGKWSLDSSISSTSLNYDDDPTDDTTGIVETELRQFEIYIDRRRKFDEYTRREMEEQDDWTMTSAWLDLWEGHYIGYEVQDYFQALNHRLLNKEIMKRLKQQRRITMKLGNKQRRHQEKKRDAEEEGRK